MFGFFFFFFGLVVLAFRRFWPSLFYFFPHLLRFNEPEGNCFEACNCVWRCKIIAWSVGRSQRSVETLGSSIAVFWLPKWSKRRLRNSIVRIESIPTCNSGARSEIRSPKMLNAIFVTTSVREIPEANFSGFWFFEPAILCFLRKTKKKKSE